MQSQIINYHKRQVYGLEKLYITDPKQAQAVSALTGRKTIEQRDIDALAILGITLVHTPIN